MTDGKILKEIENHLNELLKYWATSPKQQEIAKFYIDAYKCVLHNIMEHDVCKIDEAKKEFPDINEFKYHEGTTPIGWEHTAWLLPINYEKYVVDVLTWFKKNFGDEK